MEGDAGTAAQGQIVGVCEITECPARRSEGHFRDLAWSGCVYELRVRIKDRGNDPEAEISSPVRGLVAKLHHVIIRPPVAGTLFFGIEN